MNNKLFKSKISVCLAVIILLMCLGLSNAAIASSVDYQNLFTKSITVDGAYSDQLSIDLGRAFNADAKSFISALSKQTDDQINKVSELIVYDAYFKDLNEFEETVNNLKKETLSDREATVLNVILKNINKLKDDIKASQSLPKVDVPEAPVFDPETILSFIKLNRTLENFDEEFCETMGNAYRLDAKLFAKTIASLPDDDINVVSKFVAYDCIKKDNKKGNLNNSQIMLSDKENSVLTAIDAEISNSINADLKSFIFVPPTVNEEASPVPTIGKLSYATSPLKVGETEKLNVKFSESSAKSTARTYWTEVYCVKDELEYFMNSDSITIPSRSSSITTSYSIIFTSVGPVDTLVKVYSSPPQYGGLLLTSRAYPGTVTGDWKIVVSLPTDRDYKGTLTLYGADSTMKQSSDCLGKSVSGADMYTINGDTPTGEYKGYLYGPMSDTAAYGDSKVVNMTGISGVIMGYNRSGIWIHGGRYQYGDTGTAWYPLSPTNGCVRIAPSDQLALRVNITELISPTGYHAETGKIFITEY